MIAQPVLSPPAAASMPEIGPSDKLNVVITPTCTSVIPPMGQPVTLPPGAHVDAAGLVGPQEPPPAPPGVMNVVLPRGGIMTGETASSIRGDAQQPVSPDGIIDPPR